MKYYNHKTLQIIKSKNLLKIIEEIIEFIDREKPS